MSETWLNPGLKKASYKNYLGDNLGKLSINWTLDDIKELLFDFGCNIGIGIMLEVIIWGNFTLI